MTWFRLLHAPFSLKCFQRICILHSLQCQAIRYGNLEKEKKVHLYMNTSVCYECDNSGCRNYMLYLVVFCIISIEGFLLVNSCWRLPYGCFFALFPCFVLLLKHFPILLLRGPCNVCYHSICEKGSCASSPQRTHRQGWQTACTCRQN